MADRKSDFALPTLDDLFSTQEERDDARLEKIREIPLDLIDDFPDHPFHVRDDEDMVQLVESIKTNGVLTPAVLRQKEDGRYEIVSGHRRKRACELAGLTTLRSEIKDLTRDEAVVYMVESNFQRTTILPSEKAFAYKMRLEAMSRQLCRIYADGKDASAVIDGYSDFIFVNRNGKTQHQGTLNKAIRRIIRDCNDEVLLNDENATVLLPHFSCHSLRHTFSTRMCEAGINVKVIQDTLGHQDISTTMNIYTDATKEMKKQEFESLDNYLKKAV